MSGYLGAQDTILYSITPTVNYGTESGMSPDQQDAGGVRQGLMKFDNIFGAGVGQIPLGSTINSATLSVEVFNDSNSAMQMSLYRMLTNWSQSTATWNSFGAIGGIQASEGEAAGLPPDAILFDPSNGTKTFDVATSLRHGAAGEANFGWLIESAATNGWDFNTSEAAQDNRPVLTVDYTAPSGAGQVQFLNLKPVHTEGDSGTTVAMLEVSRLGGTTGAVSVDYTIGAAGTTATSGVDFVAAGPVTLNFAAGETRKVIPVTINGDTGLEGFESIVVTLTNAQGGATINAAADEAALTISDDDALINEVLANVSTKTSNPTPQEPLQTVDETNREYIELIGTPGASLNGYYFVVFEGEEEENAGVADLVIDLSGQTFGSNGLLVITGTSWAYTPAAGTNHMTTTRLDGPGGRIEDSSQTYALIRSTTPIVETTDYDTVGEYEANPIPQYSIGVGVGILDHAVFTSGAAQLVDSVGVVEGGGGDRDRVLTTAELGHPGVHVHQPEGYPIGNGNVTSDAVSRREGVRDPNSIGVWFNGDIADPTTTPITYLNGTTKISVVAPAGSVLTPGAENILRNVFFTVSAVSVDESAGTVTVEVTRSGDTSGEIMVDWATVNGTALAGQDFGVSGNANQLSGTLTFAATDSTAEIQIPILTDSTAEGFETFGINLSNATNPFLITGGSATVTINDGDVLVATFQDFVDGYMGTADGYLNSTLADLEFGFDSSVIVDEEVGTLTGSDARPSQGLLRFNDIFGEGAGQVPEGAKIFSAFLTLNVVDPGSAVSNIRFFRMLQDWNEGTATWIDPQGTAGGSIVNGVTPDGVEASSEVDFVVTNPSGSGLVNIPLNTETVQAWANGTLDNFGWSIVSDSGDGWSFVSSDAFGVGVVRPKLTVLYTAPTGDGTFGFSDSEFSVNENGGTATITVQRVGGADTMQTVNYEITAGTGSLADISGSATGSLIFQPGDLFKTISIPIVNDTVLERNETLNLTLSGTGLTFDRPSATLTIRDNDFVATSGTLLLSEFFINSPGNDALHEFAELVGTAGAGMGSLYFAILGGDVGEGEGASDLIVDLGTYLNGSNGTTLITAQDNWGHRVPAGATQIGRPELNNEIVSNDTASFLLLYSPIASLTIGAFDYDWDNDGILELPTGVVLVDSVAVKDNGVDDRVYSPAVINSVALPGMYVADAASRHRGNTTRNSISAWFHGDLAASGDDGIVYDVPNSTGLPSGAGTALTPGEINTGNTTQSPLISLVSVTPNLPVGTVTVTFSGPISQLQDGDGSSGPRGTGITITNPDGTPNGLVDVDPLVTGFDTNTLTLTFTGPGVIGGQLPAGTYALNFVGNSLIGNGRATDTNGGTPDAAGSDFEFEFTQPAPIALPGDYNNDNSVNAADYVLFRKLQGTTNPLPNDATGVATIGPAHYNQWTTNFGETGSPGAGGGATTTPEPAATQTEFSTATAFSTPVAIAEPTAEKSANYAAADSHGVKSGIPTDSPTRVSSQQVRFKRLAGRTAPNASVHDQTFGAWIASQRYSIRRAELNADPLQVETLLQEDVDASFDAVDTVFEELLVGAI